MKIFPPVPEMTTAGTVFCRARPSSWTTECVKQPQNLRLASARTFARRKPSPGLLRGPVLAHTPIREERGWCPEPNGSVDKAPRAQAGRMTLPKTGKWVQERWYGTSSLIERHHPPSTHRVPGYAPKLARSGCYMEIGAASWALPGIRSPDA